MISITRSSIGLAVALAGTLLACQRAVARTVNCLHYSPEIVHMSGQVKAVQKFGPPNFGETPATDEKIRVPILHLDQPLEVCGDPKSDMNPDTAVKVQDVQLIFATTEGDAKPWYDKQVDVSGTLVASHTAYHHTPVVMTLRTIAARR